VCFGAPGFSPFYGGAGRNKTARKMQSNQSTVLFNPLSQPNGPKISNENMTPAVSQITTV